LENICWRVQLENIAGDWRVQLENITGEFKLKTFIAEDFSRKTLLESSVGNHMLENSVGKHCWRGEFRRKTLLESSVRKHCRRV
jgi:hypothetical protein